MSLRARPRALCSLAIVVCAVLWSKQVAAAEPPSLEMLLQNALSRSGQVREALSDVEAAKSQVELAKSALYPKASALILAAPIFEERGNALQSTSNWSKWGPYLSAGVQVIQPIYTFGQISSYRSAADHQVDAKSNLAEVRKNEVVMTTKEFYYGYLMASDLENLVDGLVKYLEEAVESAEKSLKQKKSNVKQHDIYKLRTALDDLRQKKLLAKQSRQTAERAVQWISATEFESLRQKSLKVEEFQPKKLEDYLRLAKDNRPEFKALAAGKIARAALRDAKQAQSYPVFFVGAFGSLNWSPVREKQPSVFAQDPFNQMQGGAAFGLKFDLELKRHSAEAAEQEAELMKLQATETYAVPGIDLQVKKAFWELEQAREGLEVAERRRSTGKKWFISNAMGFSIGITPAKDLLESLEGDGTAKKNYVETVYALNIALARLSQAVGQEVTNLKYKEAKVN